MNWYLILAVTLFILALILVFFLFFYQPSTGSSSVNDEVIADFLRSVEERTGFSKPQPLPGQRGRCNVYTFPQARTQNTAVIDGLEPTPLTSVVDCYDDDQGTLSKVKVVCQREGGCIDPDGNRIAYGGEVYLYQNCRTSLQSCISLNQSFLAFLQLGDNCVNLEAKVVACDQTNKNLLFRVTKALPVSLTGNFNGPYVRILNRDTAQCLVPNSISPSSGTKITLGECDPNGGYVWWLVPGLLLRRIEEGKVVTFISPPQLVYTSSTGPLPQNLADYFQDNTSSLSLQVSPSGELVLLPFTTKREDATSLLSYALT